MHAILLTPPPPLVARSLGRSDIAKLCARRAALAIQTTRMWVFVWSLLASNSETKRISETMAIDQSLSVSMGIISAVKTCELWDLIYAWFTIIQL